MKWAVKKDGDRLFTRLSDRGRGSGFNLKNGKFRVNIRMTFLL